jgi:hypothetical protein
MFPPAHFGERASLCRPHEFSQRHQYREAVPNTIAPLAGAIFSVAALQNDFGSEAISIRHCEERERRSNPDRLSGNISGLLRFARNDDNP